MLMRGDSVFGSEAIMHIDRVMLPAQEAVHLTLTTPTASFVLSA